MPRIQRSLIVDAPVDRVYQWWASFDRLPLVMPRLLSVRRSGPHTTHWTAETGTGEPIEWDATILHDLPQRQLEWEAKAGPVPNRGLATFEPVGHDKTRVTFSLTESSERPLGPAGAPLLLDGLEEGLARFQSVIEHPATPALRRPYRDIFFRAIAASAGALAVIAFGWCLLSLADVWLIMLGALLLAATLSPAVSWLEKIRAPRWLAVTLPFVAVLVGASLVAFVLLPVILEQGQELATRLPDYAERLQAMVVAMHAKHKFFPEDTQVMAYVVDTVSGLLGNAFSLTTRFLWALVVLLSILFISLFMLLDGAALLEALVRLLPIRQKAQLPALAHTVQERVGHYMLGLVFICVLSGVLTWGTLAVMGVPYALLIGTVTSLLQAIPFVGPLVGGGLAGLIALSRSPNLAAWTLLVYTVIQQVIGQFLFPLIMGRTLGMHPVWIAIALLIGGTLHGLVGAFLAIPVAIAISIVLECYYLPWAEAKSAEQD